MKTEITKLVAKLFLGLAALVPLFCTSCATVPETGRRTFLLISPAEENQLGLTEFQKMKKSTPVLNNAVTNNLVRSVGMRIAAVANLPGAQWEFVVFDDLKTVNAFCLPGGKVGVYTGILPLTKDEDGLATVIGHEVSHAVARHGGERISEGLLAQLGGTILSEALKSKPEQTRELTQLAYGLTTTVGVLLPHSRAQELEADHIGLLYMARAGYDPRQAIEFWKRMAQHSAQQGGGGISFLRTHPMDSDRIRQLETLLPKAMIEYENSRERRPGE